MIIKNKISFLFKVAISLGIIFQQAICHTVLAPEDQLQDQSSLTLFQSENNMNHLEYLQHLVNQLATEMPNYPVPQNLSSSIQSSQHVLANCHQSTMRSSVAWNGFCGNLRTIDNWLENRTTLYNNDVDVLLNQVGRLQASLDVFETECLKPLNGTSIPSINFGMFDSSLEQYDEVVESLRKHKKEAETLAQDKIRIGQEVESLKVSRAQAQERATQLRTDIEETRARILNASSQIEANHGHLMAIEEGFIRAKCDSEEQLAEWKKNNTSMLLQMLRTKISLLDDRIDALNRLLYEHGTTDPAYHFIFILDHSGSMIGKKWAFVLQSLKAVKEMFEKQDQYRISILTFDDHATEHQKNVPFSRYTDPVSPSWGTTNFDDALERAKDIAKLSIRPVMVFLTDGEATKMDRTYSIMKETNRELSQRGLMFFTVAVGDQVNLPILQEITKIANGDQLHIELGNEVIQFLHTAQDENFLVNTFIQIAESVKSFKANAEAAKEEIRKQKEEVQMEMKKVADYMTARMDETHLSLSRQKNDTRQQVKTVHSDKIKNLEKEKEKLEAKLEWLRKALVADQNLTLDTLISEKEKESKGLDNNKNLEGIIRKLENTIKEMLENSTINIKVDKLHKFVNLRDLFANNLTRAKIEMPKWHSFLSSQVEALKADLNLTIHDDELPNYYYEELNAIANINKLTFLDGQPISNSQEVAYFSLKISKDQAINVDRIIIDVIFRAVKEPSTLVNSTGPLIQQDRNLIKKVKSDLKRSIRNLECEIKKNDISQILELEEGKLKKLQVGNNNESEEFDESKRGYFSGLFESIRSLIGEDDSLEDSKKTDQEIDRLRHQMKNFKCNITDEQVTELYKIPELYERVLDVIETLRLQWIPRLKVRAQEARVNIIKKKLKELLRVC